MNPHIGPYLSEGLLLRVLDEEAWYFKLCRMFNRTLPRPEEAVISYRRLYLDYLRGYEAYKKAHRRSFTPFGCLLKVLAEYYVDSRILELLPLIRNTLSEVRTGKKEKVLLGIFNSYLGAIRGSEGFYEALDSTIDLLRLSRPGKTLKYIYDPLIKKICRQEDHETTEKDLKVLNRILEEYQRVEKFPQDYFWSLVVVTLLGGSSTRVFEVFIKFIDFEEVPDEFIPRFLNCIHSHFYRKCLGLKGFLERFSKLVEKGLPRIIRSEIEIPPLGDLLQVLKESPNETVESWLLDVYRDRV